VAGQQQFAHWFTELIGLYYIGSGAGRQFLVVARRNRLQKEELAMAARMAEEISAKLLESALRLSESSHGLRITPSHRHPSASIIGA
jgi:hypothetical protein